MTSDREPVKSLLYRRLLSELHGFGMAIDTGNSSDTKPWGGYVRIARESLPAFYAAYWSQVDVPDSSLHAQLAPKVLLVAPDARLSLQYHHRRKEHWRVLDGPVNITLGTGETDLQEITAETGEVVRIPRGNWHRLSGCGVWGRVAEIWEHTDPANPSNEDDIVRVQDDYGR